MRMILPAQVIAVTRGPPGIILLVTRKIIQWRKPAVHKLRTLLIEWRRVVSRRKIQELVGAKSDAAPGMTTDLPLRLYLQYCLFRSLSIVSF